MDFNKLIQKRVEEEVKKQVQTAVSRLSNNGVSNESTENIRPRQQLITEVLPGNSSRFEARSGGSAGERASGSRHQAVATRLNNLVSSLNKKSSLRNKDGKNINLQVSLYLYIFRVPQCYCRRFYAKNA